MDKIVIIGGGISGLLTSLLLAANDIKSTVIEKKDISAKVTDLRNIALNPNSYNILSASNIWNSINPFARKILDIHVLENKKSQMLSFSATESHQEALAYMVLLSDLKNEFLKLAQGNNNIEILSNIDNFSLTNSDTATKLLLPDKKELDCQLVIACDGINSNLRNEYAELAIKKNFNQNALIFNVKHEKPHMGTAVEHFLPNGPFAILPLLDDCESSVVWIMDSEISNVYLNLENQEFTHAVQENFGPFLGKVEINSLVQSYPLKAHIIKKYFYNDSHKKIAPKRIAFVSDAAHHIHPLAGQGFNQGVKDISCLVNLIVKYNKLGLLVDEILLEEYHKKRVFDNRLMFGLTTLCNSLFEKNYLPLSAVRRFGLSLLNKSDFCKKSIINYASGFNIAG